jgi:hypothetical protein
MLGPTVRVVVDGPAAPAGETERLERMLARYFPPAFDAYARVDVSWGGARGWQIRRVLVGLGRGRATEAYDATRSLTACMRIEGVPIQP